MSAPIKRSRFSEKSARIQKCDTNNTNEKTLYRPWTPSGYTAFKAIMSARLCAAIWSNISDCDETYNYWEPMHYLLHGNGFQTWEYSPAYAIRSYAFLWLYAWPLKLYISVFGANKILQFYFLRCLLALVCAVCETYFYRAVCKQFGANTGRTMLFFLVFCPGMFISSVAFLPSSFTMYTTMVAMAGWYFNNVAVAVLATAVGSLVGWPFAIALGIPIAVDLVLRRRWLWSFLKWSVISLVVCLIPLVQIDSYYYGGLVIAPLNIVLYNVFSEHGPNIYGVEPWSFYFLNGFLNFNFAFPLALISLPFVLLLDYILHQQRKDIPAWLSLSAVYIWILIFFTRPHKEERFLFPIYPLLCLSAAVTVDYLQKLYSLVFRHTEQHYTASTYKIPLLFCLVFGLASTSRILALYHGYHAPLDVYGTLQQKAAEHELNSNLPNKPINICVGKEWYRFPSNFFLPHDKWQLQFIKSKFSGQLPKPYSQLPYATRLFPTHMNDQNSEEPTRYVNITKCHYLVDLDVESEAEFEPRYSQQPKDWTVLITSKFLDNPRFVFTSFNINPLGMEKPVYKCAQDVMDMPSVTGVLITDADGLCITSRGSAKKESAGLISGLAVHAIKTEPNRIGSSPVIVLETDNSKLLIRSSENITTAIYKSST